jgi:hypothetical protein
MGPAADPLPGPRLALVVATNTYTDPGLRQLRAPARDAEDLTRVLADPAIGGFAVTTVIDQPSHQVRLAIEDFLNGRGTGDVLLVYLSCHGLQDARRRLYFAASDTRKDRLGSTGVEAAWVLDQLDHCRARRQVLILDSCFSGAFAHGAKGEADLGLKDHFLGQGRGRVVLTASNATEYSFEGDPTDAAGPAGSVFTAALVQGLRTGAADTDRDGHVSVDDAYAYVFDQVQAAGAAQTPQRWLYGAEGQILLALNPAGPTIIPAQLPDSLRAGLDSPHPGIRVGAVTELGEWLTGGDPTRAATARRYLEEVADADIPRVARTARDLLNTGTTAEPTPEPQAPEEAARQAREQVDRLAEMDPAAGDPDRPTTQPQQRLKPDTARKTSARRKTSTRITQTADPAPDTGPGQDSRPPQDTATVQIPRLARTLDHTGWLNAVNSVAFSPSGKLLASGDNKMVRLWDPATGEQRDRSPGSSLLHAVAFSPNGRLLASASNGDNDTVALWDLATGKHRRTGSPGPAGGINGVNSVAFSPSGGLLAGGEKRVRLWTSPSGGYLRTLAGYTGGVKSVAFSPSGKLLATGSRDKKVRLWDPATGELGRTLTGHTGEVSSVAFSPSGRLLASGSFDKTVRLWDPATGKHRHTITGHTGGVRSVAFSPDGRLLATGSGDNTVRLWDPATGEHRHTMTGHTGEVKSVAFSPDGRLLATGSGDKTVRLWELTQSASR